MNAATIHYRSPRLASLISHCIRIMCMSGALAAHSGAAQSSRSSLFELSMEQLLEINIVSAPRFASQPENIPAAVTIIGQDQIRLYGWQTFADILQSLPGFNISNDYTYSYAAVRGLAAAGDFRSRVQVLVNGIRINENIYDSVNIDSAFLLDLSLINRIEIIRGPSASVYGGNSMVALINIVTYTGNERDGLRVNSGVRSGHAAKLGSSWGKTLGNTDMLLAGTVFKRDGRSNIFPELAAAGLPAEARGVDADEGYQIAAVVNHDDLRFSLFRTDRTKFVPSGTYGSIFNDSAHYETDKLTISELNYKVETGSGSAWGNRLYYGDYAYDGAFPYDYDPLYIINQDNVDGSWWGFESSWAKRMGDRNNLVAGFEYQQNFRQQQRNLDLTFGCYDLEITEPCLDSEYTSDVWSLYAQDEVTITARTRATLGFRLDRKTDLATQSSPRFGLMHTTDTAGTFKYLYAEAFRSPNPYERFYELPSYPAANPDLAAEAMRSHEVTWEKQIGISNGLVASVYQYDLYDFIALDGEGRNSNSDEFSVSGVEATWTGSLAAGPEYTFSLSHQDEHKSGNLDQEIMPANMFKMNLAIPTPVEFLRTGVEFRAVSKRHTFTPGSTLSGYAITNLNILYEPATHPLVYQCRRAGCVRPRTSGPGSG